jgi:site-specific recombinase XerD
MADDAYVFSLAPDGSTPLTPDSVTQRYIRMTERLGIDTHLHALRHYSATELISAGVDVRTVAGRLGHAGGGTTTLRVYAAWVSEADQRAAAALAPRMPQRPKAAK